MTAPRYVPVNLRLCSCLRAIRGTSEYAAREGCLSCGGTGCPTTRGAPGTMVRVRIACTLCSDELGTCEHADRQPVITAVDPKHERELALERLRLAVHQIATDVDLTDDERVDLADHARAVARVAAHFTGYSLFTTVDELLFAVSCMLDEMPGTEEDGEARAEADAALATLVPLLAQKPAVKRPAGRPTVAAEAVAA